MFFYLLLHTMPEVLLPIMHCLKTKKKRFRQRIFCSLDGSAVTDVAQDMTPSLLAQAISLLQVGDLVAKEDWNQLDKIMTK